MTDQSNMSQLMSLPKQSTVRDDLKEIHVLDKFRTQPASMHGSALPLTALSNESHKLKTEAFPVNESGSAPSKIPVRICPSPSSNEYWRQILDVLSEDRTLVETSQRLLT